MKNDYINAYSPEERELYFRSELHDQLKADVANCHACFSLQQNSKSLPLNHFGASVMIIGMDPDDFNLSVPKGKYFLDLLKYYQVSLESLYVTSVVKCRTQDEAHRQLCATKFLLQEISLIQPQTILCLGKKTAQYVSDEKEYGSFNLGDSHLLVLPSCEDVINGVPNAYEFLTYYLNYVFNPTSEVIA